MTVTRTVTHTVTRTTATSSSASPCSASQLGATFKVLPGSAGAGNIVYALKLTNTSQTTCSVSGIPTVQLQDANGKDLPTHASLNDTGAPSTPVSLSPGSSATSQARFSPDVNGTGESGNPCEPVASTLVVTAPGGGTLSAKIDPATSVCSHGQLGFTNFAAG